MIVQLYTVTTVQQALELAGLGVDHVGFACGLNPRIAGALSHDQAREIAEALRGKARTSALTLGGDIGQIAEMAQAVAPDIVHITSDPDTVGVHAMERLRARLPPGVELMKAIPVDGLDSVDLARRFASVSDLLLLDSLVSGRSGVGASGKTHDWNISRRIVDTLGGKVRVILAGGLNPTNVRAAIQATHPWGVDSYTGTNVPGDPLTKDRERVIQFIEQARLA